MAMALGRAANIRRKAAGSQLREWPTWDHSDARGLTSNRSNCSRILEGAVKLAPHPSSVSSANRHETKILGYRDEFHLSSEDSGFRLSPEWRKSAFDDTLWGVNNVGDLRPADLGGIIGPSLEGSIGRCCFVQDKHDPPHQHPNCRPGTDAGMVRASSWSRVSRPRAGIEPPSTPVAVGDRRNPHLLSRAAGCWATGAEQKCTTRVVDVQ